MLVAAALALVVSENTGPSPPSPVAAGTSTSTGGGGQATTTPTTVAAVAGGPPVISSLSPASGSAGQAIVVAGSNFLSSNGQIVATFNGQVAPTSCPAQNTCNVTVPASTSPSAQVAITTAGGTSNAVTFTYG
jgi:IPT/TIG domain